MMDYWHDDQTQHPPIGTLLWHIHHKVLYEPLTEPLANRLDYIREYKPVVEIKTRLRWLTPVRGKVPADYGQARADYDQARANYDQARANYDRAWADYKRAWDAAKPALEALHAVEHPGCPWDGTSLFPD